MHELKLPLRERFVGLLSEPVIIPDREVDRLNEMFREEVKRLEKILRIDLSSWTLNRK
jgi:hypothetical protein